VLSIGKLAAGQADYYLQQAAGRVNRATSVASGVEDYYVGGTEPAGSWHGAGAAALGLRLRVTPEALRRVLEGRDPASGEPLRAARGARVPGFDLTFSAPKSVSVLFGIGDASTRAAIAEAHAAAVVDALGYVERNASFARRGRGGLTLIEGEGLVMAAFLHRTSGRAIRSCIRTCWWPISSAASTAAGERWMGGGCTRTRRRRVICTSCGSGMS
jgi:conjugative relaxase-like TrwC/TraI family protein